MARSTPAPAENNVPLEPQGDESEGAASPTLFEGATFSRGPNFPAAVAPASTFPVSGEVLFDCIACELGVKRECRILIETGHGETVHPLGKLGNGERQDFSVMVTAPPAEGTTMTVKVSAQRNPPGPVGWRTDDTAIGSVPIISQGEKDRLERVQLIEEWGPFILGGAAAGYGVSGVRGYPRTRGAAVGAAVGAGSKWMLDTVDTPRLRIPTGQGLLAIGVLTGAAYFLSQSLGNVAAITSG